MAYALSQEMEIIDLGWPWRSLTTSAVSWAFCSVLFIAYRYRWIKDCGWSVWAGFRGSVCQIGCVSATCARGTASAVGASTCATGRRASASTVGTARRARPSATAVSSTPTASETGAPTPTVRDTSSAARAPTSCSTLLSAVVDQDQVCQQQQPASPTCTIPSLQPLQNTAAQCASRYLLYWAFVVSVSIHIDLRYSFSLSPSLFSFRRTVTLNEIDEDGESLDKTPHSCSYLCDRFSTFFHS